MARDKYHDLIRRLLENEGWKITHDPLFVKTLISRLEIDLGAEKIIAAEKGKTKIAVEVKSFLGHSTLHDFYKALGQFIVYLAALEDQDPGRILYLALPQYAYEFLFQDPLSEKLAETNKLKLIVFSVEKEKIIIWKE
jgi:hypothetical protein